MQRIAALCACALLTVAFPARASNVLVESTFDADADGWTALGTTGSSNWSMSSGPFGVQFAGDHISFSDPDNEWSYFSAPGKFLGDQSAAFGGWLQFDSRLVSAPGGSLANEAEVVLKGAGLTLAYDAVAALPNTWTSFSINLASGNWRIGDTFSGGIATDANLQSVLGNLTALWINGEYITPVVETIALDNVRLVAAVPEPETYGMMLAGLAVVGWAARRRKTA